MLDSRIDNDLQPYLHPSTPETRRHGMWYLRRLPSVIPAGLILVHNLQAWPRRRLGSWGFRAFVTAPNAEQFVPCDCGWASELGPHFRKREPD